MKIQNNEAQQDLQKSGNVQSSKQKNLTLIFNLIVEHAPISRAKLAEMTTLSPTTISTLTEELLDNELVLETGTGKLEGSGRRPIMLEINPAGGFVASIELLERGFRLAIYNVKCEKVNSGFYEVNDYSAIADYIVETIDHELMKHHIPENKLLGVVVGIPALLDLKSNAIIKSTVIPIGTNNEAFYKRMKARFPAIPVILGNQSSYYAYAEQDAFLDKISELIFIDINVGIGSGIVLNGEIYNGSFNLAGEIGHITVDVNGPKCKCGSRGCLEMLASVPAITHMISFEMIKGTDSEIREIVGNDFSKITMDIIKNAYANHDELATEVIDRAAMYLAFGINNVINMVNPQVIVIGGEIVELGQTFLASIEKHLHSIALYPNMPIRIEYSSLDHEAPTLGGAKYLVDTLFKDINPILAGIGNSTKESD